MSARLIVVKEEEEGQGPGYRKQDAEEAATTCPETTHDETAERVNADPDPRPETFVVGTQRPPVRQQPRERGTYRKERQSYERPALRRVG